MRVDKASDLRTITFTVIEVAWACGVVNESGRDQRLLSCSGFGATVGTVIALCSELTAHHIDTGGPRGGRSVSRIGGAQIHSVVGGDRGLLPGETHLSPSLGSCRGHEGCVGDRDGRCLDLKPCLVEGHASEQTADLVGELLSYGGGRLGAAPYAVRHLQVLLDHRQGFGEGLRPALLSYGPLVEGVRQEGAEEGDERDDQCGCLSPGPAALRRLCRRDDRHAPLSGVP